MFDQREMARTIENGILNTASFMSHVTKSELADMTRQQQACFDSWLVWHKQVVSMSTAWLAFWMPGAA